MTWWESRSGSGAFFRRWGDRLSVPLSSRSWGTSLGSALLLLVGNQAVTGLLLSLYYAPTMEGAHRSVEDLLYAVPMGWFVRSLHVWGVHLLIGVLLVHLIRTFARGLHFAPRELVWISGLLLSAILLGSAFTGQALPQDEEGYNGLLVAVGSADDATLRRVFASHVLLFPAALLLLLSFHLAWVARQGLSGRREGERIPGEAIYLHRALQTMLATLALLVSLAVLLPVGVGAKADLLGPTPENVKPAWFFLPAYQALKFVPEGVEVILAGLVGLVLLSLPWWNRGWRKTASGIFFWALLVGTAALGVGGALS